MALQESGSLLAPQVALENRRIHGGEVHHHQGVERVAELRIDVESKQSGVELQVLTKQNRHALAANLCLSHESVCLVYRPGNQRRRRRPRLHVPWIDRVDQLREIAVEMILQQERHQQAVRAVGIAGADAHRSEKDPVFRMTYDEL